MEDVPVIHDFPEVFPEELPGLPPPSQVEFRIDLVPGVAYVALFIDDILVYSKDKEEHGSTLKIILELLKKDNWFHVDPANIKASRVGLLPTTPTEVEGKYLIGCAPILALPERTEDFVVYCDASLKGYGAVLMQREKVVAYASRQLKVHKENYTTHDLELGASHKSKYSIHPGSDKMYQDLKILYWWPNMKADIEHTYVSKRLTCVKSKLSTETIWVLQQPKNPVWKWGNNYYEIYEWTAKNGRVGMIRFGLLSLTKIAHFLPMKKTDSTEKLTRLYLKEIEALGMNLDMSTAYHPQTDGQSERTIQTLEDMLRACVIDFRNSWDRHLPLVEFSYNNSYHASIKAAPYEALYGQKCRLPVCWSEVWDSQLTGPELIRDTTKKIVQIKNRLFTARSRQKSYADRRVKPLEFEVGDMVLLKVSPWKGVVRFGKRENLSPHYIGPFKILARVGPVTYTLELPKELKGIHSTFYVSNLKKCLAEGDIVVPIDEIQLDDKLHMIEEPVEVVDREVKQLKQSLIPIVKVR
ncbi:putative reverse transcriptase domain-containing protein [Tanacetum coccineum]